MPRQVAWFVEAPVTRHPKGGFTSVKASTRYRCLIPHRELNNLGVKSVVHFGPLREVDPERFGRFVQEFDVEIVVIGKFNDPSMVDLARLARNRGCYLVADFCDDYFNIPALGPLYRRLAQLADLIVAGTPQMAEVIATEVGRTATVIPDPYEGPRREPKFAPGGRHLKLLWFGDVTNLDGIVAVLPELVSLSQEYPLRLTVVTDTTQVNPKAGPQWPPSLELIVVPWSVDRLWDEIAEPTAVIRRDRERMFEAAADNV